MLYFLVIFSSDNRMLFFLHHFFLDIGKEYAHHLEHATIFQPVSQWRFYFIYLFILEVSYFGQCIEGHAIT